MKHPKVDQILHEGEGEWFVYLAVGWQLDGAHCYGEDTRSDVYQTLRRVKPCDCQECFEEKMREAG